MIAGENCQEEEVESSLRFFAEASDSVLGFNVLADVFDGFAGIGVSLATLLADCYPKTRVINFAVQDHPQLRPKVLSTHFPFTKSVFFVLLLLFLFVSVCFRLFPLSTVDAA